MSWLDQGRQEHGWFGHGTAPTVLDGTAPANEAEGVSQGAGGIFAPLSIGQRIDYAAASVIGHVPRQERRAWEALLHHAGPERLKTAIAAWYGSSGLSRGTFRARLLDPYTSDEAVDRLRSAARGIVDARTYEELRSAGENLAAGVQQIGLDRWPRFLADAERKAVESASAGNVPNVVVASSAGTDLPNALMLGALLFGAAVLADRVSPGRFAPGDGSRENPTNAVTAAPPSDAKDPNGAKAPGKPGEEEGFKDPKNGEKWVASPNGKGSGWEDADGNVWVPTGPGGRSHGGPHWDVQRPGGGYVNVYPGGKVRSGR